MHTKPEYQNSEMKSKPWAITLISHNTESSLFSKKKPMPWIYFVQQFGLTEGQSIHSPDHSDASESHHSRTPLLEAEPEETIIFSLINRLHNTHLYHKVSTTQKFTMTIPPYLISYFPLPTLHSSCAGFLAVIPNH